MEFVKPLDPYSLEEVDEAYRDRSEAQKGHAIQARAISDPMKELVHVIDFFLGDGSEESGQDDADLEQVRKAIQAASQDLSKSAPIALIHETRLGNVAAYYLTNNFQVIRKFNTVVTDQIGITLVDFQIGLPAGFYRVEASAQGFDAGHHRTQLYDVTNDALLVRGTSCDSYSGVGTPSTLVGHIVLPAPTVIELQHKSDPNGTRLSGDDNDISPDTHMDAYILITREKSL